MTKRAVAGQNSPSPHARGWVDQLNPRLNKQQERQKLQHLTSQLGSNQHRDIQALSELLKDSSRHNALCQIPGATQGD